MSSDSLLSRSFRFGVVDDAPFIRELLKQISIECGGLCVGEAETGVGCLELIRRFIPDLIFLDLVMPGKSGLDVIKEAKQIWPEIKIIACSTLDDPELMKRAISLGADEYLTKPFTKDQIVETLGRLLVRPQPGVNQERKTP